MTKQESAIDTAVSEVSAWAPGAHYGERAMHWIMQCIEVAQSQSRWPIRYWTDLAIDAAAVFGAYGDGFIVEKFVFCVRSCGTDRCCNAESLRSTGTVFGKRDSLVLYFCYTDAFDPEYPQRKINAESCPAAISWHTAMRHLGAELTFEESLEW